MESALSSSTLKPPSLHPNPTFLIKPKPNPSYPLSKQPTLKISASSTKPNNNINNITINPITQTLKLTVRTVIFSVTAATLFHNFHKYPALADPITQNVATIEPEPRKEPVEPEFLDSKEPRKEPVLKEFLDSKEPVEAEFLESKEPRKEAVLTGFLESKGPVLSNFLESKEPVLSDFLESKEPRKEPVLPGFLETKEPVLSNFLETKETVLSDFVETNEAARKEAILPEFLESNSEAVSAMKAMLEKKLEAGEDKESLGILKRLVLAQPENLDWKFLMARLLNEMGEVELAREALEEILEREPLSFEALFENALLMDSVGEGEGVIRRLEKALAVAEDEKKEKEARDVRFIIAQFKFLQKNVDEALRSYDELESEDPSDFRPYFCKGMIYSLTDKDDEAKVQFAKYRELAPKEHDVEGYIRSPLSRMKLFGTDEQN